MASRGTLALLENQEHSSNVDTNANVLELERKIIRPNQSTSNRKLNDDLQGIYECIKCGTSLFSSKAKTKLTLTTSESNKGQPYQFSKAIRKGALNRNPLKNSVNSYEVVCSKCLTCIGREVVNVESSYFIIDENFLRLRKSKKS